MESTSAARARLNNTREPTGQEKSSDELPHKMRIVIAQP